MKLEKNYKVRVTNEEAQDIIEKLGRMGYSDKTSYHKGIHLFIYTGKGPPWHEYQERIVTRSIESNGPYFDMHKNKLVTYNKLLQLLKGNTMKWKKGDAITKGGQSRLVLSCIESNESYLVTAPTSHLAFSSKVEHLKETALVEEGYAKAGEKAPREMTVKEISTMAGEEVVVVEG